MGERTAQLLKMLRTWCEQERGRQSQVARILQVGPSTVADWLSGRRKFTGEQSLKVQEFLRTVYGTTPGEPVAPVEAPADSIQVLHDSLENRATKTIWGRRIGNYYHFIVANDKAVARIQRLLQTDKLLAQILEER